MKYVKQIGVNILLITITICLFPFLFIWGVIEMILNLFIGKRFFKALANFSDVFKVIGIVADIFINYILQVPLNRLLITPDGYKFGQMPDTMSYALGRNELNKTTLSKGDKLIAILNLTESNHSIKTVKQRDENIHK
ncbi:MAG: hypothetical protein WC389_00215 [Lutibacter sp.]|jgi:hypothetical protein